MTPAADQSQRTADGTLLQTDPGPPAAPPTAAAVPGYDLGDEVGRGGMGVVYRARDREMDREVAVKLLQERFADHPAAAERFVEEATITGQLQHPGIPPIYRVGRLADGHPFLAMKLIKGRTLDELLKANATVNTLAVFEAVAQAVGYAHAHGVIHRDLKPANVMVGSFGEVQVMDWGLAKVLRQPQLAAVGDAPATPSSLIRTPRSSGSDTQAGSVLGTPAFMPPEQAAGEVDKVDQRSDVFGLGAILCVLLTGKPPFAGTTVDEVRLNAVRGRMDEALARLAACVAEPEVVALCRRCLSFEPGDRPADGNAVASIVADLRVAAEERARRAEVERAKAEVEAAAQAKRRRLYAGLAAALLLGVVGTGIGMWQAKAAAAKEREATTLTAARLKQIERINETVFDIFAEFDIRKVRANGEAVEAVLAEKLVEAGRKLDAQAIHDPIVLAGLQNRLGQTLERLGHAPGAIELLTSARATRQAQLGPDHHDTLVAMDNLAGGYASAGRLAEALPLWKEALRLRKAKFGPDHPYTLKSMNNLATGYRSAGRLAEALPLFEETLRLMKAKLGPNDPDMLVTIGNLAGGYRSAGRLAESLPLLEEALRLMKARVGPNHPDTLTAMNSLALGYQSAGRPAEAVPLFEEALQLTKAKLGPDHRDTLVNMNNLAGGYHSVGRLTDAVPLYEEALRLMKAKLGPDHRDTLINMGSLASGYQSAGRLAEALPLFEETLGLMKAKLGSDHPTTLLIMNNLAGGYQSAGRLAEAVPLFEEAARGVEKRRFQHEHASGIIPNTSGAYEAANRWADAERWRRTWADHLKQTAGLESPAYAGALAALGLNLQKQGKWPDAETVLRESLTVRTKTQPDEWTTFNTQSLLGAALLGQKKYADAEPLLVQGYDGLTARAAKMPKGTETYIPEALDRLVELYTATDKPDQAAKYRELRAKYPPPKQP